MVSRYTHAVLCRVPQSLCSQAQAELQLEEARKQHQTLAQLLRELGVDVIEMPPDEKSPLCCFVEDLAVVVNGIALIARPSESERLKEIETIRAVLKKELEIPLIEIADKCARLDGGDILFTGTEIDDEEYFATLEKNTSLMILQDEEKWIPVRSRNSTRHVIFVDDTDNCAYNSTKKTNKIMNFPNVPIESLVSSLHSEPSHISLLAETDLETLSDMDPDSLADIFSDRLFLESLKEASGKFLAEKRQADDSVALLEMLSSNNQVEDTSTT